MAKRTKDFDRGMVFGVGLACSILQRARNEPTIIVDALNACGLNRSKLIAAGLEPYDIEILAPVFAEQATPALLPQDGQGGAER